MRRARRGDQEGFATLSSCIGPHFILAPDVAGERSPVGLIEEGVDQGVDSGGDVAHPDEDVEEVMKQRLVAGAPAQDEGDVGDEEGAPHDEEEEEDDSQDLKGDRGEERTKVKSGKRNRRGEEMNKERGRKEEGKGGKKQRGKDNKIVEDV